MIGILLALQVNNWNEKNKEIEKQVKELSNLRSEIQSMQVFLEFQIRILEVAKAGSGPLLELMGPDASLEISPDSINSLFRKAVNTDLVTVEKLSFETQLNFGSAQEIKYAKLLKMLSNWKHFTGRIAADFTLLEANREKDLRMSLIGAGVPGFLVLYMNDQAIKFPVNYESMLQSQEVFANLYYRNFRMGLLARDLKRGLNQLDKILSELDEPRQ